jgi:hypothetical protein
VENGAYYEITIHNPKGLIMPTQSFKRVVAKYLARSVTWSVVAHATSAAAHAVLDVEDDTLESEAIDFGSLAVGFAVSGKLQPYTDRAVDAVADRFARNKLETGDVEVVTGEVVE